MNLQYKLPNGASAQLALADRPITIGRSPKADIILDDERVSRLHCGIRKIDDDYYLKDLASKNGTFLNNQRVENEKLSSGDRFRVGSTVFSVEKESSKGTTTAFHDMQNEMSHGKGYDTLLKEIVKEVDPEESPSRKPIPKRRLH